MGRAAALIIRERMRRYEFAALATPRRLVVAESRARALRETATPRALLRAIHYTAERVSSAEGEVARGSIW